MAVFIDKLTCRPLLIGATKEKEGVVSSTYFNVYFKPAGFLPSQLEDGKTVNTSLEFTEENYRKLTSKHTCCLIACADEYIVNWDCNTAGIEGGFIETDIQCNPSELFNADNTILRLNMPSADFNTKVNRCYIKSEDPVIFRKTITMSLIYNEGEYFFDFLENCKNCKIYNGKISLTNAEGVELYSTKQILLEPPEGKEIKHVKINNSDFVRITGTSVSYVDVRCSMTNTNRRVSVNGRASNLNINNCKVSMFTPESELRDSEISNSEIDLMNGIILNSVLVHNTYSGNVSYGYSGCVTFAELTNLLTNNRIVGEIRCFNAIEADYNLPSIILPFNCTVRYIFYPLTYSKDNPCKITLPESTTTNICRSIPWGKIGFAGYGLINIKQSTILSNSRTTTTLYVIDKIQIEAL